MNYIFINQLPVYIEKPICQDLWLQSIVMPAILFAGSLSDVELNAITNTVPAQSNYTYKQIAEPMWPQTRSLLTDFYKPFNRKLAELLNHDGYKEWNRVNSK